MATIKALLMTGGVCGWVGDGGGWMGTEAARNPHPPARPPRANPPPHSACSTPSTHSTPRTGAQPLTLPPSHLPTLLPLLQSLRIQILLNPADNTPVYKAATVDESAK